MTGIGILQIAVYFALILVCVKPLGSYMAQVFEGRRTFLHPALRWLEVLLSDDRPVSERIARKPPLASRAPTMRAQARQPRRRLVAAK